MFATGEQIEARETLAHWILETLRGFLAPFRLLHHLPFKAFWIVLMVLGWEAVIIRRIRFEHTLTLSSLIVQSLLIAVPYAAHLVFLRRIQPVPGSPEMATERYSRVKSLAQTVLFLGYLFLPN